MQLPPLDELNRLSVDAAAAAIAPLFEGAPRFAWRIAERRPFATEEALIDAARQVAANAPEADLVELLDAHPRIGADPSTMSPLSQAEQGDDESPRGLVEELQVLNDVYEARFGFRYVVFVAGRPRWAIAPLIEMAVRNERGAELRRGVSDAIYIAADRLQGQRAAAPEASDGPESNA